jgi:putative FmdB family regulatory protein
MRQIEFEGFAMPVYEYTCQNCKKSFEKLQRNISSHEDPTCPECGSTKTARKLSLFAVGAEQAKSSSGGCGRCGGPGPCALD